MESINNSNREDVIVPIYTDHGERKLLFNLTMVDDRLAMAFVKNGITLGYCYLDDVIRIGFTKLHFYR